MFVCQMEQSKILLSQTINLMLLILHAVIKIRLQIDVDLVDGFSYNSQLEIVLKSQFNRVV